MQTSPPETPSGLPADDSVSRRGFLVRATIGLQGLVALLLGAPLVGLLAYPLWGRTTFKAKGYLPAGDVNRFPIGRPRKVMLRGAARDAWLRSSNSPVGAVWVVRRAEDRFDVYSTICPHLGCAVNLDPGDARFLCPCHGSHFALSGQRIEDQATNPSPRDMDPLQWKVERGRLLVRYQRFEFGVPERRELS